MYNGIGLYTARGSGTNGYVQRNLGFRKPQTASKDNSRYNYRDDDDMDTFTTKPISEELREHERKRALEVKVFEWALTTGLLYDTTISDEERDLKMAKKREEVAIEAARGGGGAIGADDRREEPRSKKCDW
eukprot:TRINITY_DN3031_c0_g1_i1.p2 TRINITY_DN3031_c0_g1~~TRINITY_DN3031_c0_g1_i1.p2  ORF type:complete len:145 (-),score=43.46 TRINITY_DN3031_c0_g1_i1:77-469(-)